MIKSVQTINPEASPKEPEKRASEREAFAQALELKAGAVLAAALDPRATASLPGAGTALAEAEGARQDVSQVAARRLTEQRDRQGTRERGLDAASQARRELAEQARTPAQTPIDEGLADAKPGPESIERQRLGRERFDAGSQPGSTGSTAKAERAPVAVQSAATGTQAAPSANTAPAPSGDQAAASTGAAAGVAGANSAAGATNSATGASSGVSGVGAAPGGTAAGGRSEAPGVMPGQMATPAKATAERGQGRVYRQEPRDFGAQLQRGLAQVLRQRGGTLSLKLDPAELGTVKVSLKLTQGRVEGTIEAANERARGLLFEHLESLKGSLEHRGITVDRLDVRLAGAGEGERQFAAGQEAGRGLDQHGTGAGSDRESSGGLGGGERQPGERGRTHALSRGEELRGAEDRHTDDSLAQGRAGEPHGGWLRLDTLA